MVFNVMAGIKHHFIFGQKPRIERIEQIAPLSHDNRPKAEVMRSDESDGKYSK
jgi:hypothetical protein